MRSALDLSTSIAEAWSTELIVELLLFLPYKQIVCSRRVCRRFRVIIDETTSLQLAIELGAAGYSRCESKMSTADALATFRQIQKMYRDPKSQALDHDIVVKHPGSYDPSRAFHWQQVGNILFGFPYGSGDGTGIPLMIGAEAYFLWLGLGPDPFSPGASICAREVHHVEFNDSEQLELAATDADQDLLVLRSREALTLHFVSLITGAPHPRLRKEFDATTPFLLPPLAWVSSVSGDWLLVVTLRLRDDTEEVVVDEGGLDVQLYHWPSRTLKGVWSSPKPHIPSGFVHNDTLIMPIHKSIEGGNAAPSIHVYALPTDEADSDDISLLAIYALPSEMEHCSLHNTYHKSGYGRLFEPVETLCLLNRDLYVPSSVFLCESLGSKDKFSRLVTWEEWSPYVLRTKESDDQLEFSSHHEDGFGLRCVHGGFVLDFNQYDVARNIYEPSAHNSYDDYTGPLPDDDKTSRLPYRLTPRPSYKPRWYRDSHVYFIEEQNRPLMTRVCWDDNDGGLRGMPEKLQFCLF